jgi:tetratricopeptide (TPR) repeat protein
MAMRIQILVLIAIVAAAPASARGQATDTVPSRGLPGRCVVPATPTAPVSDSAKSAAREIMGRAQAASIVGDNAAASALYQQAAKLDPTDASIAYALGRGYEAAGDSRAMTEYCRFLALSPHAPEASDVRQRIAELALALPPDTTVVRIPVSTAPSMPSPGAALAGGIIIPGLGQFMTRQPAGGILVMAAAAAGIWYGLQTQQVSAVVTRTGTDPFGNPYQYQTTVTKTERQHAAVGLGGAGAVALIGAIEAFAHARSGRAQARNQQAAASINIGTGSKLSLSAYPVVGVANQSVGLGFTLR